MWGPILESMLIFKNAHNFSVEEMAKLALAQFESEAELCHYISELSHLFTKERTSLDKYLNDPKFISAYTIFYLPSNYYKLFWLLSKGAGFSSFILDGDFYDIGSGPGTYSLAILDFFKNKYSKTIYSFESSRLMQQQYTKMLNEFHPNQNIVQLGFGTKLVENPTATILFGNSLNEMGFESALKLIDQINPQNIMMIEPGTKESFSLSLKLRDDLTSKDYFVYYPCPSGANCPIAGTKDWCHQYINVSYQSDYQRLFQLVRKNRARTPATCFLLSKRAPTTEHKNVVVGQLNEDKHSIKFFLCEKNNDNNKLFQMDILKRGLNKKRQKELLKIDGGDGIDYQLDKLLDTNRKRIKILE